MDTNHVEFSGVVDQLEPPRVTPAGVSLLKFKVRHVSEQLEAAQRRRVECLLSVIAIGSVANAAKALKMGDKVRIEGFLAKAGLKSDWPELHARNIVIDS